MTRKTAVVICPGRGTYNATELGYLGRHFPDPTLLARLALPGGSLLQPLLPGRPCRDCLFVDVWGDGVSALKVWNMNACGGVLALFNVQVWRG